MKLQLGVVLLRMFRNPLDPLFQAGVHQPRANLQLPMIYSVAAVVGATRLLSE